jgi:hypothetical protein
MVGHDFFLAMGKGRKVLFFKRRRSQVLSPKIISLKIAYCIS